MTSENQGRPAPIPVMLAIASMVAGSLLLLLPSNEKPNDKAQEQPRVVEIGSVIKGPSFLGRFYLTNDTGVPISIVGVDSDCGCLSVSSASQGTVIKPGAEFPILYTIATKKIPSVDIKRHLAIQYVTDPNTVQANPQTIRVAIRGEIYQGSTIQAMPGNIRFNPDLAGDTEEVIFLGDSSFISQLPDRIEIGPDQLEPAVVIEDTSLDFKPAYKAVEVTPRSAAEPYRVNLNIELGQGVKADRKLASVSIDVDGKGSIRSEPASIVAVSSSDNPDPNMTVRFTTLQGQDIFPVSMKTALPLRQAVGDTSSVVLTEQIKPGVFEVGEVRFMFSDGSEVMVPAVVGRITD